MMLSKLKSALRLSAAAIILPISLLGFSPAASAQDAFGIVATVNDDVITSWDLQQRVFFTVLSAGVNPDEETLRRIQIQALRGLIDERLQMQEARKFDLEISDEEVDRSIARLAQGNGLTPAELEARMFSVGVTLDTLKDQVRAEIAWQRIVNGRFGSRIRVSDNQIDETLRRIKANAGKPSYLVSEIYIEASEDIGGMDGAMEGARAMISQFEQGAPFTALARQFSSSASSAKGGDVGWVLEGDLRPEINASLQTMEKGAISQPIAVPGGVYVVVLRDKKESETDTVYQIQQVRIPTEGEEELAIAERAITDLQAEVGSCEDLPELVDTIEGASAVDMGEVRSSTLSGPVLAMLEDTDVGEMSDPVSAPNGVMALMVCDAVTQGADIPTRDEVENRIIDQQLAQQSRRYLRDIRRSATIETR